MSTLQKDRKVWVVKKTFWDVVIEDDRGLKEGWLHDTEKEAVDRADHLVSIDLCNVRGTDRLIDPAQKSKLT